MPEYIATRFANERACFTHKFEAANDKEAKDYIKENRDVIDWGTGDNVGIDEENLMESIGIELKGEDGGLVTIAEGIGETFPTHHDAREFVMKVARLAMGKLEASTLDHADTVAARFLAELIEEARGLMTPAD